MEMEQEELTGVGSGGPREAAATSLIRPDRTDPGDPGAGHRPLGAPVRRHHVDLLAGVPGPARSDPVGRTQPLADGARRARSVDPRDPKVPRCPQRRTNHRGVTRGPGRGQRGNAAARPCTLAGGGKPLPRCQHRRALSAAPVRHRRVRPGIGPGPDGHRHGASVRPSADPRRVAVVRGVAGQRLLPHIGLGEIAGQRVEGRDCTQRRHADQDVRPRAHLQADAEVSEGREVPDARCARS